MAKEVNLKVQEDHIRSIIKAKPTSALLELIWNSLDADSTKIRISRKFNSMGHYESIEIEDNGHGLTHEKALAVFSQIGGSEKKQSSYSPQGRCYHGKEGKGRLKSLSLGGLVTFVSNYKSGEMVKQFTIIHNVESPSRVEISDSSISKNSQSGFKVTINNIDAKTAAVLFDSESIEDLKVELMSYWLSYKNFEIEIGGQKLNFEDCKANIKDENISIYHEDQKKHINFRTRVIEWNVKVKKKIFFCNNKGIPYYEEALGIRSNGYNVTVFIESDYIEHIKGENITEITSYDPIAKQALDLSKDLCRKYIREKKHEEAKGFIDVLKEQKLYPYKEDAKTTIEKSKRKLFDLVALEINDHLPEFEDNEFYNKKLTLALIKEIVENDSKSLTKILTEVINLPEQKRKEMAKLLEEMTLSNIIDTMSIISNRLSFLDGLEQLIYNDETNENVKERVHLHKIIVNETWIFGDEFTYGADDISLRNVLKKYIKASMGRPQLEESIEPEELKSGLNKIPDVCLFRQFNAGAHGHFKNLIIELKKPTVDAGFQEMSQIQGYANTVGEDPRFPKDKTKWIFYLVVRNIKPEIKSSLSQEYRKYGHVQANKHIDVHVLTWGDIINDTRARYQFLKEKLDIQLKESKGAKFLKERYEQYLPHDYAE